ncbi:phosphorylase [Nitrogeniibacter mangrovi]|uniref:Phosphorylase n=1 Tax=Nitrogeniibacter mangrovi TaxID=2016596 RepID=A0A6C1B473_9RHOO|nr:DUF4922 domain-containing protein [Nitrogeniibacter mangrovi]QID18213.1 phosphorylase [Nitrogeniibacter mangrovi]
MNQIPPIDLARIDATTREALASHALKPIETEREFVESEGLPFVIKWVSTLADKPRAAKPARGGPHNPFAAPEPALLLGDLPPSHRVLLNKFPVMARHLLVVTQQFEAQSAALSVGDLHALAVLVGGNGGLGFYNGGTVAGASQPHKHLQWIPELPPLAACLPRMLARRAEVFTFRHAFASIDASAWRTPDTGAFLQATYARLLAQAFGSPPAGDPPPYNLLLTRDWMWLVPRRAEFWEDMSINALGFAGSLFVKSRGRFDALKAAGPINALRAVAVPA